MVRSGEVRDFLLPPFFKQHEIMRNASLLQAVNGILLVTVLLCCLLLLFFNPENRSGILIISLMALPVLLNLPWLHRGRVQFASWLLTGMLWLIITVQAYWSGGLVSPMLDAYLLVVLVACVFLNRRGGVFFIVLSLITMLVFLIQQKFALTPTAPLIADLQLGWVEKISFLVIGAPLIFLLVEQMTKGWQKAEENALLFQAALDSAFHHIGLLSPDGQVWEVNEATLRFAGVTRQQILNMPVWETPLWRHSSGEREKLQQAVMLAAAGQFVRYETEIQGKKGQYAAVDLCLRAIRDEEDEIRFMTIEGWDVSGRKKAEAKLRSQASILQQINDAVITMDMAFNITSWNEGARKLYGWEEAEVIGKSAPELFQAYFPNSSLEEVMQTYRTTGQWRGETVQQRRDGLWCYVFSSLSTMRDKGEKPIGIIAINRDISDQKQTEFRYQELFEAAPVMYAVLQGGSETQSPTITQCNRLFAQNLGYRREEIIGQPIIKFLSLDSQHDLLQGGYHRALLGQSLDEERTLITKDNHLIETILHTLPYTNAEGEIIGTLSMYVDITRRKEAERQVQEYTESLEQRVAERTWELVQSEEALRQQTIILRGQNEELDAFAHTVAHDLRNPLSHITGYAELLKYTFEQMDEMERQDALDYILQGGNKMNAIIRELLTLASVRKEDVTLEAVAMGDVLAEAMLRLYPMIETYQAQIELPSSWPLALGYGPWLEEVWANYLSNGMKYGGQAPVLVCGATVLEDERIAFWVRDNGSGLTEEAIGKLFTQFTRLERGRADGHGLGLSIVQRILNKLGGEVFVESIPGQGSTFGFILPHWDEAKLA